jgi:hypothetical protein
VIIWVDFTLFIIIEVSLTPLNSFSAVSLTLALNIKEEINNIKIKILFLTGINDIGGKCYGLK